MATTRLIIHHISKGETIAQSLADRFDYGQNPDKTQQGELISSYQCDAETADAEFLLSKAKYKAITGREQKKDADILPLTAQENSIIFGVPALHSGGFPTGYVLKTGCPILPIQS